MPKISIRRYQSSNQKALVEIFKNYIPSDFAPDEIHDFTNHLANHGHTYFCFEADHRIIGGIGYQLTHDDSIGRIKWILFNPKFAGKGLGSQAVKYCLSELLSKTTASKSVITTSQLAYRFFEKFGFRLLKTEKDFWGKGLDLYQLEMDLVRK